MAFPWESAWKWVACVRRKSSTVQHISQKPDNQEGQEKLKNEGINTDHDP
jgi:hypothetical protein